MYKHSILVIAWSLLLLLGGIQFFVSPSIMLEWETQTETNSAGFNLYRQQISQEELVLVNGTLISTAGNSNEGAIYQFRDQSVKKGQQYLYFLEEIELDGTAVSHPTFSKTASVPYFPSWLVPPIVTMLFLTVWTLKKGILKK